ncbi:hypothetical protein BJ742DRAFT_579315 [Cladochytrium replicatum]|nr:hypothetical protein BJ742DRAFT_579315 [Cladochytrium replicatum]
MTLSDSYSDSDSDWSLDHFDDLECDEDESLSCGSDRPSASLLTSLENITDRHEQSLLAIQRTSTRRIASLSCRLEQRRAHILSRIDRLHHRIDRSRSIVDNLMDSNSHDDRVASRVRRHIGTIDRTPVALHDLSTTLEKLESRAEWILKRIEEDAQRAVERATAEKERLVNVHRRYIEISASRAQQLQQQQQQAAAANATKQAAENAAAAAQPASRSPPVVLPSRSPQQQHYISFVAPPQPQQRTLGRPTPRPGTQAVQFRQIYVNHLQQLQRHHPVQNTTTPTVAQEVDRLVGILQGMLGSAPDLVSNALWPNSNAATTDVTAPIRTNIVVDPPCHAEQPAS